MFRCNIGAMNRSFYGRKEAKELGKKVELNIKATMNERWVNDFLFNA